MGKKNTGKKENTQTQDKDTSSNGFQPVEFAQEARQELNKIVWPSRQQLIGESAAVVLMVILVATIVYLVDNLFSWGAGKVFG
ncbi:MAG: preprotein translocase subunit SecE [Prochloraceae cyanobacterium]